MCARLGVRRGITADTKLFLFNFQSRMLHGVFTARGQARLNIDAKAWASAGGRRGGGGGSPYPAQLEVEGGSEAGAVESPRRLRQGALSFQDTVLLCKCFGISLIK